MPYAQVPALIQGIAMNPVLSARALTLCVLTATRTTETIEAKWDELDLENRLWIIPKERMKRGIEHRVPLSIQAIAVLRSHQDRGIAMGVHGPESKEERDAAAVEHGDAELPSENAGAQRSHRSRLPVIIQGLGWRDEQSPARSHRTRSGSLIGGSD